jgi:hypothetical protein
VNRTRTYGILRDVNPTTWSIIFLNTAFVDLIFLRLHLKLIPANNEDENFKKF